MQFADYFVLVFYLVGMVAAGMVFASRMKNSREMFAAGGRSPWWVSGLSGFMTMFSAGTFVVWGGIAYEKGFVAVAINMCYGVSALLVGWLVAGVWRRLGVDSAPAFLRLRFGGSIVQFYTWFQGTIGIFAVGGAIYALSKIVCALVPLPATHLFADSETRHLSVAFLSVTLCLVVILVTFLGGLWAVLITDVLQFVILTVSVLCVVPLIVGRVGGWGAFVDALPEGFAAPVSGDFGWWFLTGWVVIHFFKIGGEWSFVQRYTCVPTVRDARKAAWLFGVLYLVSPLFWMLPALVFRVLRPGQADPEQAYILACGMVLPAGMMGLMVAAMASATASAATSQLNVFAGAFTQEFYRRLFRPDAPERELVLVGRLFTMLLGGVVMAGALLIPRYGYTTFIIDLTTLLTGPLVLPTIWGLFSRRIGIGAVWATTLAGFGAAVVVKFGMSWEGLAGLEPLRPLADWVAAHRRVADLFAGIIVPLAMLAVCEGLAREEHPGWARVQAARRAFRERAAVPVSTLPAKMVGVTLVLLGLVTGGLAIRDREDGATLAAATALLLGVAAVVFGFARRADRRGGSGETAREPTDFDHE